MLFQNETWWTHCCFTVSCYLAPLSIVEGMIEV